MTGSQIRFEDGAAYERIMGIWSRLAGAVLLDWLAPASGQNWIDVGCGNGAFTELLVERCAPAAIVGVDPSEGQLRFARARHVAGIARFERGDAMALPGENDAFDAAVMALVIFFVPEPARAVAEMRRVVRPGGTISAYAWDMLAPGGFPLAPMHEELRAMGLEPVLPPSVEVSRLAALQALWADAGLIEVATREIVVSRTFASFEDLWATVQIALGMAPSGGTMAEDAIAELKQRLRARLRADAAGRIAYASRANAVTGRVP